ncbi:unnamed protein product [Allacma fusca]|uniref:Uncharacterized protein n=1 Tax=Allacma fusca TaxID=39272 RepID=A0A8J2NX79_9HEXA|nr:unnamed protein product [Allacma fusca]
MASLAVESNPTECNCERNPGGTCNCVTNVPCAFNAENKTVEWTCECQNGSNTCRCKFQIRCNRQDGEGCCGDQTELLSAKCDCGARECTLKIRKCQGCEVTRVDCECPEGGSCGAKTVKAQRCEGCECGAGSC